MGHSSLAKITALSSALTEAVAEAEGTSMTAHEQMACLNTPIICAIAYIIPYSTVKACVLVGK